MNKKHVVFAFIALAAIGGAFYFGTATNHVLAATKSSVSISLDDSANLTKEEKVAFQAVVSSLEKLNKISNPSTEKKRVRFVEIGGYCFLKSGGEYQVVNCPE